MNFESHEEESAMKTVSFYCCKFCTALLKPHGTEVIISLIAHLSSMHNISLKAGFDTLCYAHGLGKWGRHKNRDDYQN
jgi:hypothetical protein